MSLTKTIDTAVEQAFSSLSDLVKEGILENTNYTGFNFSNGTTEVDNSTKVLPVIVTEVYTKDDQSASDFKEPLTQILVKTKDIGFSRYSKITISGIEYRIEQIKQYEGITVLLVRG